MANLHCKSKEGRGDGGREGIKSICFPKQPRRFIGLPTLSCSSVSRCFSHGKEGRGQGRDKGIGRGSGSAGGGRGHTVPVRLVADCRLIAGAGPLSSSPAAITVAARSPARPVARLVHIPPLRQFFFSSHFSLFSHFDIFKKSLPETSDHVSVSLGAPGWLTCLPTLSHLQTIHSQLSLHNRKHTQRSFLLLLSRSKTVDNIPAVGLWRSSS